MGELRPDESQPPSRRRRTGPHRSAADNVRLPTKRAATERQPADHGPSRPGHPGNVGSDACISTHSWVYAGLAERNSAKNCARKTLREAPKEMCPDEGGVINYGPPRRPIQRFGSWHSRPPPNFVA